MEIAYVVITGVFTILGGIGGVFLSGKMNDKRKKQELLQTACENLLSAIMLYIRDQTPGNQNLLCVSFAKAALIAPEPIGNTIRELTCCALDDPIDASKLSTLIALLIEQSRQEFKYK